MGRILPKSGRLAYALAVTCLMGRALAALIIGVVFVALARRLGLI